MHRAREGDEQRVLSTDDLYVWTNARLNSFHPRRAVNIYIVRSSTETRSSALPLLLVRAATCISCMHFLSSYEFLRSAYVCHPARQPLFLETKENTCNVRAYEGTHANYRTGAFTCRARFLVRRPCRNTGFCFERYYVLVLRCRTREKSTRFQRPLFPSIVDVRVLVCLCSGRLL